MSTSFKFTVIIFPIAANVVSNNLYSGRRIHQGTRCLYDKRSVRNKYKIKSHVPNYFTFFYEFEFTVGYKLSK